MTPTIHRRIIFIVRLFLVIVIALLATNMSSPALAQSASEKQPPVQADTPEAALQLALDQYMKQNPSAHGKFELGEVYTEKDWAYAIARPQNTKKDSLVEYVVLLASNTPDGWRALAPQVNDPTEYNALLRSFPFSLIDESNQAMFALPEPAPAFGPLAVTANYSGHLLPFPAGDKGYVPKKDTPGHENQVDFDISPSDTIYASKPGKVVFVKESSNSGCNDISCWQQANMVVIQHSETEYSWYVHLAYNSVTVNVNSYVGLGTKIGIEGTTGYSSGVHLHYMVSSGHTTWTDPNDPNAAPWGTGMAPVDFDEVSWANLIVGNTYTSRNTSDPGVVSWGWGRTDLFVQGEDGILYHKVYNGSWGTTWEKLDGFLTSAPDAASWGSGHMDVYVRGLDNNLYYRRYLNGAWGGWLSAGAPPGGAMSNPGVVSAASNQIDLFVRGTDNALWHRRYNYGWGNWEPLGGILTTGPDAASPGNGQIQVFVAGIDKVMWRCTYSNGTYTWDQVPGGASAYDQSGVSPSIYRVDVFARGTDAQLYHRIWNGSSWGNWEPLDGFLTSGPDAASWRQNNHLDVFVRGTDNNIYHRWQYGGGWSNWEGLGKP